MPDPDPIAAGLPPSYGQPVPADEPAPDLACQFEDLHPSQQEHLERLLFDAIKVRDFAPDQFGRALAELRALCGRYGLSAAEEERIARAAARGGRG